MRFATLSIPAPPEELPDGSENGAAVAALVRVADIDTLYRDVYLERARERLAPLLSYDGYLRNVRDRVALARALRDIREAVEREDWIRIAELASKVRALRNGISPLQDIGEAVYEAEEARIHPLSRILHRREAEAGERPGEICRKAAGELALLEDEDPLLKGFYAGRREYFLHLSGSFGPGAPHDRFDFSAARLEAMEAAKRGNMEMLEDVAGRMVEHRRVDTAGAGTSEAELDQNPLSEPFPEDAATKATSIGLSTLRLPSLPRVAEALRRSARDSGAPVASGMPQGLRDFVDFISSAFLLTSGGLRYRPALVEEMVMVEDFPEEDPVAPSPLIGLLGLRGRTGLSRSEIDRALFRKGGALLRDRIGLDPLEFRMVCLPPDVYARAGSDRGWGRKEGLWTHFDGYQVGREGTLLALVGGDPRFGGIYDICSLGRDHGREGVVARLAIVRRRRLFTRYA
jgi:hypothetical protein